MKLLIIGSCVSRDVVSFFPDSIELIGYYARSSLVSVMSRPIKEIGGLDDIESNFQRRMVCNDLKKSLRENISQHGAESELIVLDFIDERFDILEVSHGCYITLSGEARKSGFIRSLSGRLIKSGSSEHANLWKHAWDNFVFLLRELGLLHKVVVNQPYWSVEDESKTGYEGIGYHSESIYRSNKFLYGIYSYSHEGLSSRQMLKYPPTFLVGSTNHVWGASPFHFVDDYYKHLFLKLKYFNESGGGASSQDGYYPAAPPFFDYIFISFSSECEQVDKFLSIVIMVASSLGLSVRFFGDNVLALTPFHICKAGNEEGSYVSGYYWKEGSYLDGDFSILKESELSGGDGFFSAFSIRKDDVVFFNDVYGMGAHYHYSSEGYAVVTNRSYLAAYLLSFIKKPVLNRRYLASSALSNVFFSGQSFSGDMPLDGLVKVGMFSKIELSGGCVKVVKCTPQFLGDESYFDLLKKASRDIEKKLLSLARPGRKVIFDLTGGYDSRAAICPFLGDKQKVPFYVRTSGSPGDRDVLVSNLISAKFGLQYEQTSDVSFSISFHDSLYSYRGFFLGEYGGLALPRHSSLGSSKNVRVGGSCGEIYRDFWGGILQVDKLSKVNSLRDLLLQVIEKEGAFPILKKFNFYDEIVSCINDVCNERDGWYLYADLNDHYLEYRNRVHFGSRMFSTFHDAPYVFPLLSKEIWAASKKLKESDRWSGKVLGDFVSSSAPSELLEIPYEADVFKSAEALCDQQEVKEKMVEWQASEDLRKKHAGKVKRSSEESHDWRQWEDLLDVEVCNSLSRIFFYDPGLYEFLKYLYSRWEALKIRQRKAAHRLACKIFGVDDALFPSLSKKEAILKEVSLEKKLDFLNPISRVEVSVEDGFVSAKTFLKHNSSSLGVGFRFAFYLFSGKERIDVKWYSDSDFYSFYVGGRDELKVVGFVKGGGSEVVHYVEKKLPVFGHA